MEVLPETVVGPRLTLRRWRRDDVAMLRDAVTANLEHLRPWMPWIAFEPMSDDDRVALIEDWESDWQDGGDVVLGAFLNGTAIGSCGLHRRRGPGTLEIGYWVHVDHVGQGYATEIARVLTEMALAVPGITRVEIHHDRANIASRRIPELLGYRLDGESADEPAAPGEIGIDVCWSTTAETWSPPPTPTPADRGS